MCVNEARRLSEGEKISAAFLFVIRRIEREVAKYHGDEVLRDVETTCGV